MHLKFIYRTLLFLSPFILIWLAAEVFLYQFDENLPVGVVIKKQHESNGNLLYQRGLFNQQFNVYKHEGINYFKPEILVVGSSRVMQFRKIFFHPFENKFYNAGGMLQCADDLFRMTELMEKGKINTPKVLIIGLDPWWFKKDYSPNKSWLTDQQLQDDAFSFIARVKALPRIASMMFNDNSTGTSENYLGYYARVNQEGFREDGSLCISQKLVERFRKNPVYEDRENPPVINRLKEHRTSRFSISQIDTLLFIKTFNALKTLQKKNIEIIIYLPPFSSECLKELCSKKASHSWWSFYQSFAKDKLKKEFYIFDPSSSDAMNLPDNYFLDGFHPGEVLIGHHILKIIENLPESSYLSKVNKGHLDSLLNDSKNLAIFLSQQ